MSKKPLTYKDAGVDIQAGETLIDSIKSMVKETHSSQVLSDIGGFGGLFAPDLTGFENPVFVSSVDGVGTKLIVAFKAQKYDTVGQDLVNHCVNDIAVCGAKPLFFLDYFSTGKLVQEVAWQVIKGFTTACKQNGLALIGGETAEMPDIYSEGEFDLAGTIVGIVERDKVITGEAIRKGNVLIGISSSGLHTNGYSLARKVIFSRYDIDEFVQELGMKVSEALLSVHKSYLPVIEKLKAMDGVNGFVHVTGGGIEGNTGRILPDGLQTDIHWDAWKRPALFNLIQNTGNVPEEDMRRTFNLGLGLVVIAKADTIEDIHAVLKSEDEEAFNIGTVEST